MNNITNFKAKTLKRILVLFAIFIVMGFPFSQKGESLNKVFAQSGEAAKI